MAGILAGMRFDSQGLAYKATKDGEHCRLEHIPDDVLAQELIRRKRIQWFHADGIVTDMVSEINYPKSRAELIAHHRWEMMVRLGNELLDRRFPIFSQSRDEGMDALRLRLSLPVFIRT